MRRRRRARARRRRVARSWFLVSVLALFVFLCCAVARRHAHDAGPQKHEPHSQAEKPAASERIPGYGAESPYCLFGCPRLPHSRNRILFREGYVLSNNPTTKFADWAAYRITRGTIGKSKRRDFEADPDLTPEETLEPEDIRGAHSKIGIDRGHQVPLASFSGTRNWQPLNYLSNMTPQRSKLNQELWNRLEQAERELVLKKNFEHVFVVTGPLFEKEMPELPAADESHRLPSGYFKVIAVEKGERVRSAAIIVLQDTPGSDSHCQHRVTIDEVEGRARLDLFTGLPDAQEEAFESKVGDLFSELGCK